MTLQIDPSYEIPADAEIFELLKNKVRPLADVIKARSQKVINDNPEAVKHYIVQMAKDLGYSLANGDVSNVHFEHMVGEDSDWGLECVGFEVLNNQDLANILPVYAETYINNTNKHDSSHFKYVRKVNETTTWRMSAGFTIKGKHANFKGWELSFEEAEQVVAERSATWRWEKQLDIEPNSKTTVDALLKQRNKNIYVKASWRLNKGEALCSCDIRNCGTIHQAAHIPIKDILANDNLATFDVYGEIEELVNLYTIVEGHSELYPQQEQLRTDFQIAS